MDRWNGNIPGGQGGPDYQPNYQPNYPPQPGFRPEPVSGGYFGHMGEEDDLVFIPDEDAALDGDFYSWEAGGESVPAEAEAPAPEDDQEEAIRAKRKK